MKGPTFFILACLTYILVLTAISGSDAVPDISGGEEFQITPLPISSGIYYEHLGAVRRSVTNWRVTVFLDMGRQRGYIDDLKSRLEKLRRHCVSEKDWCHEFVIHHPWEDRWEMAMELQEQFQTQVIELENSKKSPVKKLTSQLRLRRSVPLLGFLGKIAGPVAGVLNYEDGERYDAIIQDLNAAQANLSHLVGQQTHVVRSQLDTLHAQINRHGSLINETNKKLDMLIKKQGELPSVEIELEKRDTLFNLLGALKTGLDHTIRVTHTMLEAVHNVRQGKLYPGLISSKQLEPILRDIQDHITDVQFPLPGPAVSIDELVLISTTTILCADHQLKILIDIPLLEKYNYQALKMYPLPTIQEAMGNKVIRAYIKTEYDYLITDEEQHTYLLLTEQDWKSCKSTTSYHACFNGVPIYELKERPACEPSLLINPTVDALKNCKIQVTNNPESFWKPLTTLASWLYSFSRTEEVVIICHSMTPIKTSLNGTGVLKLAPGCMAKARDAIIPATVSQVGETEIIYEPDLHLNLTALSPIVSNYGHLLATTINDRKREDTNDLGFSTFEANSQTLDELERQLEDFAIRRHMGKNQTILVYGSYIGISLLCILLLLCLCHMPLKDAIIKLVNFWPKKSRTGTIRISTERRRGSLSNNQDKTTNNAEPSSSNTYSESTELYSSIERGVKFATPEDTSTLKNR